MPTPQIQTVIQQVCRAVNVRDGNELADGQLLRSYVASRNEAAFELLVRRHGPMVLGVCQRLLGNPHDAEDAFQATFLILARKATSVTPAELVGNWLYGVAYRTALEARSRRTRHYAREKQVMDVPHPTVETETDSREVLCLLDQELARLPEKYRVTIVLCDLEGRSRKEVAEQTSVPEGTVSSRLTTARRLLAERLSRHGLKLSAGVLATLLSRQAAQAVLPPTLVVSAVKAASLGVVGAAVPAPVVALAEGTLRIMLVSKLKTLAACAVAFCLLTAGLGLGWATTLSPEIPATRALVPRDMPAEAQGTADDRQPKHLGSPKNEGGKKEEKGNKVKAAQVVTKPFSKIHVKQGTATIRQTDKDAVVVKGEGALLDRVETSVEDGTLYLTAPHPDMEFFVEVKELTCLTVEGVGTVEVKDLKGKKLEVALRSAAQVTVTGTVDEQVVNVSAGGRFSGDACKGKWGTVRVEGGSRAVVHVTDKLKATIAAGGQLEYLGSPQVKDNVSPGGTLRQRVQSEPKNETPDNE